MYFQTTRNETRDESDTNLNLTSNYVVTIFKIKIYFTTHRSKRTAIRFANNYSLLENFSFFLKNVLIFFFS